MVLGTIPVWEDQLLLCKRAIEPRLGYWTLPAGFLENGESTAEGALRETMEEAGANVALEGPFSIYDVLHVHQVHMFYRAKMLDLDFSPGPESLEVRLFKESEIPWEDIAFKTVAKTLRAFFEDRARGHFRLHIGPVDRAEQPI
jgi:ADP-ribose pyrophosphatase YjhB (NUDIX family)